jgi:hypothetical protein
MLKLIQACAPWLSWKAAGIAALVALGVAICLGMPSIGLLVGAAPVLLMIGCLVPCLIPLMLPRGKEPHQSGAPLTVLSEQRAAGGDICGCGHDSCGIGDGPSVC